MRARCSAFVQHLSVCARAEKFVSTLQTRLAKKNRTCGQLSTRPKTHQGLLLCGSLRLRELAPAALRTAPRCHAAHCARGARASTRAPQTAPGVSFAPWTTKTGVAGPHQKASHAPPQHRRPLFGVRELVRARNSHLTNGCARCSGVDTRPTKPHQA